jgi:carboxypeptidase T
MNNKFPRVFSFLLILLLVSVSFSQLVLGFSEQNTDIELLMDPYDYYSYPEMTDLFIDLANNHSDIMSMESLGRTYRNREVWLIKLSDNVNVTEDEPSVLLMGAHHGDERPAFEVLIYFIKYMINKSDMANFDDDGDGVINEDVFDGIDNDYDGMIDEDPSEDRVREILENTQIYLIPMVNPDGVEFNWRKNRSPNYGPDGQSSTVTSYGVDLNRNYGYRWYIPYLLPEEYNLRWLTNDESWTYRGETPFCEVETQAVKSFVETHDVSISLSYHDYGEWMIFPWMHTSRHTPHEELFRSIGYEMAGINKYELKIYGQYGEREYLIPRFCGTPGSSENWLYGEHEIIAYTIELCQRRPELNTDRVLDACWKHVGVNLFVSERSWTIEAEKEAVNQRSPLFSLFDFL